MRQLHGAPEKVKVGLKTYEITTYKNGNGFLVKVQGRDFGREIDTEKHEVGLAYALNIARALAWANGVGLV